jgi:putative colanic acid biosynthesis acetyltransferase WcaF
MPILDARLAGSHDGGPCFPLSHRVYRAVWTMVWLLFAAWTPPPLRRWRVMLLNLFGAELDPSCHVYGSTRVWYPRNLKMARLASLGPRVDCYCIDKITLGEKALVSQGATLCTGSHDITDPHFQLYARPITLEAHAWVASEAFVGPGVTLGEGAVLGARGVAFKDLDPWTVYAGNPCRALKARSVRDGGAP